MSSPKRSVQRPVAVAAGAALLVLAQLIAGKVVRDTLFLSTFPARDLSIMMIAAAALSLPAILPFSRAVSALGPARAVPAGFLVSALAFAAEWALFQRAPAAVAVLLYLHLAIAGGALVSGFWSVVNERFDPRTGRRSIGPIVGAAALGGAAAGFSADWLAGRVPVAALLPALAVLQVACAGFVWRLGRGTGAATATPEATGFAGAPSGFSAIRASTYLRDLAVLTLVVTVSQGLLEFAFKFKAQQLGPGTADLQRVLARVHTLTSVGIFGAQALFSRWALERLGIARTVLSLPLVTAAGTGVALAAPGLGTVAAATTGEGIVHSSLFRSGYELLYAPLPAAEKRSAKSIIDVGFGRMGDLAAGALAWYLPILFVLDPIPAILVLALVLSVVAAWFSFRLQGSHVRALERSLVERAAEADMALGEDALTRTAVFDTMQLWTAERRATPAPMPARPTPAPFAAEPVPADDPSSTALDPSTLTGVFRLEEVLGSSSSLEGRFAALQSGDVPRAREVLQSTEPLAPELVSAAVPFLGHRELAQDALLALRRVAARHGGQLVDALLDPAQDLAVRRRLPRVLSAEPTARIVDGLLHGLVDAKFEVRYQSGLALSRIHNKAPELAMAHDRVLHAIENEVETDREVWRISHALDDDTVHGDAPADLAVRERSDRSLEHVFTLLSLILPQSHLHTAYLGIHAKDPVLRGTALEYLDVVLPASLREKLWPYLADEAPRRGPRPKEQVMADLERLSDSVAIRIDELRRQSPPPAS